MWEIFSHVKSASSLPLAQHEEAKCRLRERLDAWYASSPPRTSALRYAFLPHNFFDLMYNTLFVDLYRPSHYRPETASDQLILLRRSASRAVAIYADMIQQRFFIGVSALTISGPSMFLSLPADMVL